MPTVATLTTLETIAIVAGIVAGLGALIFAAVNYWLSIVNERKRTQPIVLAHQVGSRRFADDLTRFGAPTGTGHFVVDVRLSNDGEGAAFNVRFGALSSKACACRISTT